MGWVEQHGYDICLQGADYSCAMACVAMVINRRQGGKPTEACKSWLIPASSTPSGKGWAWEHRGATVQKIVISGDRAAATLSKDGLEIDTVQLRRTATGEWLIDKLGPVGAVGSSR